MILVQIQSTSINRTQGRIMTDSIRNSYCRAYVIQAVFMLYNPLRQLIGLS